MTFLHADRLLTDDPTSSQISPGRDVFRPLHAQGVLSADSPWLACCSTRTSARDRGRPPTKGLEP